jgi:tetratricopeptide (TPR) repeat protein
MSIKIQISFLLLTSLMLIGASGLAQTPAEKINENIKKIETYLYQNPSVGKTDLFHLLEKNQTAPDTSKGYIYLSIASSYGILNQLDSGLWAVNQALALFTDKNLKKASSLRTKAILYRLKGEYKLAESTIKESLRLNDSIWKNKTLKAVTLQEYASLCFDQNNFYQATRLYLEALDVVNSPDYKDAKGTYNALKIKTNLAEAYAHTGNHRFAIRTFQEVLPRLDSLKDYDGYIRAGYQLAESYIQTNKCTSADSLVQILLPLAKQLKNEELESYLILKLGLSRSQQLKYQEALPYYRQAFGLMEKNHSVFILDCAIPLLNALKNTGGNAEAGLVMNSEAVQSVLKSARNEELLNYKKIAIEFIWNASSPAQIHAYYQDILRLSDIVKGEGQKQLALELQAKYQFEVQEKTENSLLRENELLRQSERYKRNQILLILLIASLLLLTCVLLLNRYRQNAMLQSQQMQMQQKEINLQKQQTEWALNERNYRDELLEQQKALLTQTLADSEELKEKMNQLVDEQELDRRIELLKQFEHSKEDKMGLEKLLVRFNSVYPSFLAGLHNAYPKLSQSDLQFCILSRMNLSTKDISMILHVEPRSIYTKKYRLMEKMELGKEDDFDKIIFNMR